MSTQLANAVAAPAGSESFRIDVDGLPTALLRKGGGEPLLYLHDEALSDRWLPFLDLLAQRFDVIAPHHPGFGGTAMPAGLRDFTDMVLHYDALLEQLGLDSVHVVGAGLGGWIAAELAVFYPRRVRSLTLIAPTGIRVPEVPPADPFRWSPQERIKMLLGDDSDQAGVLAAAADDVAATLKQYGEAITLTRLTWNPRYDIRLDHRLARVAAPGLVVRGADDAVVSAAHAERYAELIPGATLRTVASVPGRSAAHLVHLSQPEVVAGLVRDHAAAAAARS